VIRVDAGHRELAYVNAGHPPGIVLGGSRSGCPPLQLASGGPPAGFFPDQHYQTATLRAPDEAVSVLVTDGITEAFDELGLARDDLVSTLVAHLPQPPTPVRICDALIDRTAPALQGREWHDDRTVVAFALSDVSASRSVVSP